MYITDFLTTLKIRGPSEKYILALDTQVCPEIEFDFFDINTGRLEWYTIQRRSGLVELQQGLPYSIQADSLQLLRPRLLELLYEIYTPDEGFRILTRLPEQNFIG